MTSNKPAATFFNGQRREMVVDGVSLKRNKENERRIMLLFKMPLATQPLTGMGGPIAAAYSAVGKLEDGITEASISCEIEGITMEIYPHAGKDAPREQLISAATLRKLLVSRPESEHSKNREDVDLYFNTTIPFDKKLWNWSGPNVGSTIFIKFDATQAVLVFNEKEEKEDKQMGLLTSTEDAQKMMAEDKNKPDYKPQVEQTPERTKAVNGTTDSEADKLRQSWRANQKKGKSGKK